MNIDKMNKDLGLAPVTIKGHNFEINTLPCGKAGEVFIQMLEIFGPTVGVIIDKLNNMDYVNPEEDSSFTEVLHVLTSKLVSSSTEHILDTLLEGCRMDGRYFDKNKDLRGEFSVYLQLIRFAVEENFSDFFIEYLQSMGLEIPSWKELKEMLKKNPAQEIQEARSEAQEETPKSS